MDHDADDEYAVVRRAGWYWVKRRYGLHQVALYLHQVGEDDRVIYSGWHGGLTDDDFLYIAANPLQPPEDVDA